MCRATGPARSRVGTASQNPLPAQLSRTHDHRDPYTAPHVKSLPGTCTWDSPRLPRASAHAHTLHDTRVQAWVLLSLWPPGSCSWPVVSSRRSSMRDHDDCATLLRPSMMSWPRSARGKWSRACAPHSRIKLVSLAQACERGGCNEDFSASGEPAYQCRMSEVFLAPLHGIRSLELSPAPCGFNCRCGRHQRDLAIPSARRLSAFRGAR